jgi:L-cysteine:1D-myo-inositol 2-amino-2-deoxy-alpha-D-glucopyranoside ligase
VKAWPRPTVPTLPGRGLPLRVHDTATGTVVPGSPGPTARLYVCGITPYDATHLGHAATYIAFDLLQRAWLDAGHQIRATQNVTDIDDPLLERAVATGQDWRALAERETELFRADMAALRVLPPDHYVGAVESMSLVVDAVQRLQDRGAVYDVDGDRYFDVTSDPTFGSVARWDEARMVATFAERGGDPSRAGKRHPLDPLLWQAARPDEPAWDSELGHGRPGWHVECTAIARDRLGAAFDVQGGGRDLAFPHHEMCAAIGHALEPGLPFARRYVHAGMVGLDGEKMSKSKGNLVLVSTLRHGGHDPMVVRLALLAHHYRGDWSWTDEDLVAATRRWARWRDAVRRPAGPPAGRLLTEVREAVADDLDAPRALDAVDRWCDAALDGRGEDRAAPALVAATTDALLGVALGPAPV